MMLSSCFVCLCSRFVLEEQNMSVLLGDACLPDGCKLTLYFIEIQQYMYNVSLYMYTV